MDILQLGLLSYVRCAHPSSICYSTSLTNLTHLNWNALCPHRLTPILYAPHFKMVTRVIWTSALSPVAPTTPCGTVKWWWSWLCQSLRVLYNPSEWLKVGRLSQPWQKCQKPCQNCQWPVAGAYQCIACHLYCILWSGLCHAIAFAVPTRKNAFFKGKFLSSAVAGLSSLVGACTAGTRWLGIPWREWRAGCSYFDAWLQYTLFPFYDSFFFPS